MIREVEGDILLSQAEAIAHGIAPSDHFTHGLAMALRERFPAMAKDFRHYCQQNHPKPGEVWLWGGADRESGSIRIVNLLTQQPAADASGTPGKATFPNVNHALKNLAELIVEEGIGSIALPRLATGVGGLDWVDVRPLVVKHLSGLGIPVVIYTTYHKGVRADEKLTKAA